MRFRVTTRSMNLVNIELLFIHSFIHFNSGSKAHKQQQTEAMA